jgi:hypothetical protein
VTSGKYGRIGLGYHTGSGNFYAIWWGEAVAIDYQKIYDMGALPIPPDPSADLWVFFELWSANAGADTATIDFLQLQPAEQYQRVTQNSGFDFESGDGLISDGIQGFVSGYYDGAVYPIMVNQGNYLHIYPGQTQRIRVLWNAGVTYALWNAGYTITAQAWYRPRRLTV